MGCWSFSSAALASIGEVVRFQRFVDTNRVRRGQLDSSTSYTHAPFPLLVDQVFVLSMDILLLCIVFKNG